MMRFSFLDSREKDVDGIDLNMGCPKEFSLKGGMGAALLTQPLLVQQILTNLVNNLSIPVTCKIRVMPTVNGYLNVSCCNNDIFEYQIEETITLVDLIERTGVKAIAVHGRNKMERPQHSNRVMFIKAITKVAKTPIIAK